MNPLEITPSSCWIVDGQLHPLVRPNNEDSSGGQRQTLLGSLVRINHPQLYRQFTFLIGNDGVRQLLHLAARVLHHILVEHSQRVTLYQNNFGVDNQCHRCYSI